MLLEILNPLSVCWNMDPLLTGYLTYFEGKEHCSNVRVIL